MADRPISALRNLGPKTEAMLAEVDIPDEAALRALGTEQAWRRLKFRFGRHVTVNALFAIEGALTGRDWRDLDPETKERLRRMARETG